MHLHILEFVHEMKVRGNQTIAYIAAGKLPLESLKDPYQDQWFPITDFRPVARILVGGVRFSQIWTFTRRDA